MIKRNSKYFDLLQRFANCKKKCPTQAWGSNPHGGLSSSGGGGGGVVWVCNAQIVAHIVIFIVPDPVYC